jgi:hypothetical protein
MVSDPVPRLLAEKHPGCSKAAGVLSKNRTRSFSSQWWEIPAAGSRRYEKCIRAACHASDNGKIAVHLFVSFVSFCAPFEC